ncbi:MAG: flavoprotein [Candidatus Altiarchaeota archaeon]|nr:flavoprotein [Candidatus Altiarchaeota archaeon]
MKTVVVGVCGSVAAVRVPELVRELSRRNFTVQCAMSEAAKGIIHPNVLEWASQSPVITGLSGMVEHVQLLGVGGKADLLLICPATSNTISKIACGIDDTAITTMAATALGSGKKVIIVPAMHISMYDNVFVKENIQKLKKAGVIFVGPKLEGTKAKIADETDIVKAVEKAAKHGKK